MAERPPISSHDELFQRQFVMQDSGHYRWLPWSQLRDQCTPKFRRIHERLIRRVERELLSGWFEDTRRAMTVATRKYRARKKRKS